MMNTVSDGLSLPRHPMQSLDDFKSAVRLHGNSILNAFGVKGKGITTDDRRFRDKINDSLTDVKDQLAHYTIDDVGKVQPLKLVGDLVSDFLSPITQGLLAKPNVPKSQSKLQLEDSLTNVITSTFGLPKSFTKAMIFEGADVDQAMTQQFIENIDKEYNIPGLGERVIEEYNKHERNRKAHAAARVAAEDIAFSAATGGLHGVLTYA